MIRLYDTNRIDANRMVCANNETRLGEDTLRYPHSTSTSPG